MDKVALSGANRGSFGFLFTISQGRQSKNRVQSVLPNLTLVTLQPPDKTADKMRGDTLSDATAGVVVRMAEVQDCPAILDIYSYYIEQTAITLFSRIPSVEDFARTMMNIRQYYPYLVCCVNGTVVGFAHAFYTNPHEAYCWNAELNVYIKSEYHGRGIATALYTALFQILKAQGYCSLYAAITLPSEASIALHKHFGFKEMYIQEAIGYKLGEWRDVLWMGRRIEGAADPELHGPPLLISDVNKNDIDTALAMASTLLTGVR